MDNFVPLKGNYLNQTGLGDCLSTRAGRGTGKKILWTRFPFEKNFFNLKIGRYNGFFKNVFPFQISKAHCHAQNLTVVYSHVTLYYLAMYWHIELIVTLRVKFYVLRFKLRPAISRVCQTCDRPKRIIITQVLWVASKPLEQMFSKSCRWHLGHLYYVLQIDKCPPNHYCRS